MVDAFTAAGLASSIISFLDLTYKVGKRVRELKQTTEELPSDLVSAYDLIQIIARTGERLKLQLAVGLPSGIGSYGPQTEQETALETVFGRITDLTTDFLAIVDELNESSNVLSKALRSMRRESSVDNIREEMDRCILLISQLLAENLGASGVEQM
jgi:hypothetical protein